MRLEKPGGSILGSTGRGYLATDHEPETFEELVARLEKADRDWEASKLRKVLEAIFENKVVKYSVFTVCAVLLVIGILAVVI